MHLDQAYDGVQLIFLKRTIFISSLFLFSPDLSSTSAARIIKLSMSICTHKHSVVKARFAQDNKIQSQQQSKQAVKCRRAAAACGQ